MNSYCSKHSFRVKQACWLQHQLTQIVTPTSVSLCALRRIRTRSAVFVFICTEWHRLCTTPTLVWSGGIDSTVYCEPPAPPSGWGGQSHCLCLSQSSLLCSKLEDLSSWSATSLITHPRVPFSFFNSTSCPIYFWKKSPCPVCCIIFSFLKTFF